MERRQAYGGVIVAIGLVLALIQVANATRSSNSAVVIAVEAVPMVAVALAFAFTGVWLARQEEYEPDVPRIIAWSAGGAIAFVSFAALMLFNQNVAADELIRAPSIAVDNITVGATSGLLVGLYDARSRHRLRDLETERDRVSRFAEKAADMNNYGRAIANADAVSGVSAFCIQAVSTLLGFRQTAFVEVSDGAMNVVGDTTVGMDRETLGAVVDTTLDQEVGAVVVTDGLPESGGTSGERRGGDDRSRDAAAGSSVGQTLTVHVTETADVSVAMVAVTDETDPIADEDRQLLELLVSHAGTALDGLYADGE